MSKIIKIAVDAMGGDNSPKKIIDGINHHYKSNANTFYQIFGDKEKIQNYINQLPTSSFEIIHTKDLVKGTDSPLEGAKRGKNTSMWLAIQSVKEKKSDIVISAGNTGALLVISKLNLKMIENIDKPALSALWPNKKMKVYINLFYAMLDKIHEWDTSSFDLKMSILLTFLDNSTEEAFLVEYFDKYWKDLSNSTFNSHLKGVIKS